MLMFLEVGSGMVGEVLGVRRLLGRFLGGWNCEFLLFRF